MISYDDGLADPGFGMRRQVDVSVIIPTHDGTAYIGATIDSVLRQTTLPGEILVVDDCSKDRTVDLVAGLVGRSRPTVRIIRLEQNSGGPARPINVGVEAAAFELIAVLEQDDHMAPTRVARSAEAAEQFPTAGLICGRVRLQSPEGETREDLWRDGRRQFDDLSLSHVTDGLYRAESRDVIASLLRRNIVFTNSNVAFLRDTWRAVGGFDPTYRLCSDLDFNLKIASRAPYAVVDEVLCDYHERADSLYHRGLTATPSTSPAHFEALLIRLRHALRTYGLRHEVGREWYRRGWRVLLTDCRHRRWRRCARVLRALYPGRPA
jgi:glycosyltransferase involved in cell wall biosynthesis